MASSQSKKYQYLINCIAADGGDITRMTAQAREVTFRTFVAHCEYRELAKALGYDGSGLTLGKDYHVSFYKSRYRGVPCYYMKHSSVEFVFVAPTSPMLERRVPFTGW